MAKAPSGEERARLLGRFLRRYVPLAQTRCDRSRSEPFTSRLNGTQNQLRALLPSILQTVHVTVYKARDSALETPADTLKHHQ